MCVCVPPLLRLLCPSFPFLVSPNHLLCHSLPRNTADDLSVQLSVLLFCAPLPTSLLILEFDCLDCSRNASMSRPTKQHRCDPRICNEFLVCPAPANFQNCLYESSLLLLVGGRNPYTKPTSMLHHAAQAYCWTSHPMIRLCHVNRVELLTVHTNTAYLPAKPCSDPSTATDALDDFLPQNRVWIQRMNLKWPTLSVHAKRKKIKSHTTDGSSNLAVPPTKEPLDPFVVSQHQDVVKAGTIACALSL